MMNNSGSNEIDSRDMTSPELVDNDNVEELVDETKNIKRESDAGNEIDDEPPFKCIKLDMRQDGDGLGNEAETGITTNDNDMPQTQTEIEKAGVETSEKKIEAERKELDKSVLSSSADSSDVNNSKGAECPSEQNVDPLAYTKAEEFTSEIFKIQVHNLPKFGFGQLKKRLISLGLKPHKMKSPNPKILYICFRNEADRIEAVSKINGHVWKGRTLEAKNAAPAADPFYQKKQQQGSAGSDGSVPVQPEVLSKEEAEKRLKDSVVPLWNMEYSEQLKTKGEKMVETLKKITRNPMVRQQFRQQERWKQDGMPCPMFPIIPSPVISEYRNKNEFTVGYADDGTTIKVGFRYGLYKNGTTTVGDCSGLNVVKPAVLPIVQSFEKFVCCSRWKPYLQQTGEGHWHTLTVRSFDSGDMMAMADFHPRKLDKNEIEAAKNSVQEFYTNGESKDLNIKSFYFRLYAKGPEDVPRLQHVFGEQYVYETLLGLKFRISPEAFFQVNTKATEKLYSLIGDWCQASDSSTVLDLCCGTGTIGLSLASRVSKVIGVEMCQPALEDAKVNAVLNGISNTSYFCSKVEDIINHVLSLGTSSSSPSAASPMTTDQPLADQKQSSLVAVVDPPRAGLHKNVIKTLRKCEAIERLVYVSCNPDNAMENFIDLIRPTTGKTKGPPFVLTQAVPVDLFPGTRHCELVLLFTRNHCSQSNESDLDGKNCNDRPCQNEGEQKDNVETLCPADG